MGKIKIEWPVTIHKVIKNTNLNKICNNIPILEKLLDRLPQTLQDKIFFDTYTVSERVVERGFVFMNIGNVNKSRNVLDIGCCWSTSSFELASLGFKVWSIDIEDYPFYHPNLTFIKSSAMEIPFKDNFFDTVIAISTVEHIGLGHYGDPIHKNGDKIAINEIYRVLRGNGKFIMTTHYGKKMVINRFARIYDKEEILSLLDKFEIIKINYFLHEKINNKEYRRVAREEELNNKTVDERNKPVGTICIVAIKK